DRRRGERAPRPYRSDQAVRDPGARPEPGRRRADADVEGQADRRPHQPRRRPRRPVPEGTSMTRVAIVTGAARGIGAATAVRLAGDGMDVAVLDLHEVAGKPTVERIAATGRRGLAVGVDVSDADQVAAAVARVASELGPPTVLVNNAGVIRDNLLFKMTDDD